MSRHGRLVLRLGLGQRVAKTLDFGRFGLGLGSSGGRSVQYASRSSFGGYFDTLCGWALSYCCRLAHDARATRV